MLFLIEVDLSRAVEHECPGIILGAPYLAKIGGRYWAGHFCREWYGLRFHGWYGRGLQFDAPGFNSSDWEGVWLIEEEPDAEEGQEVQEEEVSRG